MPQLPMVTVKCGVCSGPCEVPDFEEAPEVGYLDLDGRPPPPRRERLVHEIAQCPGCGYCSTDMVWRPPDLTGMVTSAHRAILGNTAFPLTARRYLAAAAVLRTNDRFLASQMQLSAAWVCDDIGTPRADGVLTFGDTRAARAVADKCRLLAAATLREMKPFREGFAFWRGLTLVDALRRAGQFDEARAECEEALASGSRAEALRPQLEFELRLIRASDLACHSSEECATPERRKLEAQREAERDNPLIGPEVLAGARPDRESGPTPPQQGRGRWLH